MPARIPSTHPIEARLQRLFRRRFKFCCGKVTSLTPQLWRGDYMPIRTRSRFNGLATRESPFKGIPLDLTFVNRLKIQLTRFGASSKSLTLIRGDVFSEKVLGLSGIRLPIPNPP